jgi:hypothetical protein
MNSISHLLVNNSTMNTLIITLGVCFVGYQFAAKGKQAAVGITDITGKRTGESDRKSLFKKSSIYSTQYPTTFLDNLVLFFTTH